MKKMLFTLLLALPCALFAQNMTQSPAQEPQQFTMELKEPKVEAPKKVQLELEIPDSDVQEFGISKTALQNEITTRLQLAQIQIKDEPNLAKLVLRVKSIQADRAVATFVQMGFFEEAQLKRNKGMIMALTWSQATLISGSPEDVNREVMQLVTTMTNAFILEYHKAMAS